MWAVRYVSVQTTPSSVALTTITVRTMPGPLGGDLDPISSSHCQRTRHVESDVRKSSITPLSFAYNHGRPGRSTSSAKVRVRMERIRLVFFIPTLLICGCSSEEEKAAPATSKKEHVFKDQVRALEKTKELEQVLQNQADKRGQAIEKQSK